MENFHQTQANIEKRPSSFHTSKELFEFMFSKEKKHILYKRFDNAISSLCMYFFFCEAAVFVAISFNLFEVALCRHHPCMRASFH